MTTTASPLPAWGDGGRVGAQTGKGRLFLDYNDNNNDNEDNRCDCKPNDRTGKPNGGRVVRVITNRRRQIVTDQHNVYDRRAKLETARKKGGWV